MRNLRGVGKPDTLRAADANEGRGVEAVFKTRWAEGSVLVRASVQEISLVYRKYPAPPLMMPGQMC